MDKDKLKVLSLFSGCGGMDLGFEGGFKVWNKCINEKQHRDWIHDRHDNGYVTLKRTMFDTVFANDILPEARAAWIRHFSKLGIDGEKVYHLDSIVDLVKRHEAGENIFPDGIDVVTGGFPCQDFSMAGKRRGFKSRKNHRGEYIDTPDDCTMETRGMLYYWMKRVIDIVKPKIFYAENVKGLTNLENVKDIIQHDFSTAGDNGYIVLPPRVLHAADYGVAQSRERVIFIGIRVDALRDGVLELLKQGHDMPREWNPYPIPTHEHNYKGDILVPGVTCQDVLGDALKVEPDDSMDPSHANYAKCKYMGAHCQGNKEIDMDGIAPTIRSEHHGNIEFRRLSFEHGGKHNEELNMGLQERRLTPRECGLIQSFPPDYEFVIDDPDKMKRVSTSMAYKVIGNAVPPLLAYNIAKRLETLWDQYFK